MDTTIQTLEEGLGALEALLEADPERALAELQRLQGLYMQLQEEAPGHPAVYDLGGELERQQDAVLEALLEGADRELQRKARWVEGALRRQTWDHARETLEALLDALRYHAAVLEASGARGVELHNTFATFAEDVEAQLRQVEGASAVIVEEDAAVEAAPVEAAPVVAAAPVVVAAPVAVAASAPREVAAAEPAAVPDALMREELDGVPLRELFPAAYHRLAQLGAILDRAAVAQRARELAVVERHLVRVSEEWRAFDGFYGRRLPTEHPEILRFLERLRDAAARLEAVEPEPVLVPVLEELPVEELPAEEAPAPALEMLEDEEPEEDDLDALDTGAVERRSGGSYVSLDSGGALPAVAMVAEVEDDAAEEEGPSSGGVRAYDLGEVRDYAEDDAAIESALDDAFDDAFHAAREVVEEAPAAEEEAGAPMRLRFSSSATDPWDDPGVFVAGRPIYGHLTLPDRLAALTGEAGLQTSVQVKLIVDGEVVATHTFYPEAEQLEQAALVIDVVPDPDAESPQWNSRLAEELANFAEGSYAFGITIDSKTNTTGEPLGEGALSLVFEDDGSALVEVSDAVRRARRSWRDAGM